VIEIKFSCHPAHGRVHNLIQVASWSYLQCFFMYSFQDRSFLSVTPKYLNVLACLRGLSLILIETMFKDLRRRVLPNKTNFDLLQLKEH